MKEQPETNLRFLKRTNKRPMAGDVFRMQLPNMKNLFGRVIVADAAVERAPMPTSNLVYVFKGQSDSAVPDRSRLLPGNLLVPPIWTNRLGWTKGYFQKVDSYPLGRFDTLKRPCFYSPPIVGCAPERYYDELGERVESRVEPCGVWGLVSYRWIDDRISDALSIPRAPVLPGDT